MGASPRTLRMQMVERSRRIVERGISESAFQRQVVDVAHLHGWRVAHFRSARTKDGRILTPVAADAAGWPDLVLVHPDHGILYRELKTNRGRLASQQQAWGQALIDAGADWAIWRPRDWELILQQLGARR